MMCSRIFRLLLAIAILFECSHQIATGPDGEGNGSETTARGIIIDSIGNPAAGIEMHLLPADYNPVSDGTLSSSCSTLTDTNGEYSFKGIGAGTFNIESGSSLTGQKAFVKGIASTGSKTEVAVVTGKLQKTSTVRVDLQEMDIRGGDYVYLPGTNTFTIVSAVDSASEQAVLTDVPAGVFTDLIYVAAIDSQSTDLLRDSLTVYPGDIRTFAYTLWTYNAKLILNTAISGADVQGTVYDFPVLVRLDEGVFDFSQVKSGGEDIRFSKSDGMPLVYEIEQWDAVARNAEIWVKVDTVHGNDSTQHILMYWGNQDALDRSDGAGVFDTVNGFKGVWHMNEDPSAGAGSIKDRSANNHNATPYGSMNQSNSKDGAIGKALMFDGKDDFLSAGNVSIAGTYSIGLWVQLENLQYSQRFIFKDSSYTLWYDSAQHSIRMEHMPAGTWWRGLLQNGGTPVPMTGGVWHYFTGTFDGTAIRVYENGVEVSRSDEITEVPIVNSFPLLFGKAWNVDYVKGVMDEIRIEKTARSADWVKLCYMNQRIDNKLIKFE